MVDNLNRATTISSVSRTYDILGNTTAIGSTKSMGWDALNRMTSFTASSATTNYAYRADGMRVSKAAGTQTVTYGYDGQMGVEECLTDTGTSSNNYTTRYGLGARGIDRIETTNSSGTSAAYPIYDAHGNTIATIAKAGSGSYSLGTLRSYDAWGGVLSGSTTGSPSGRYCANLGHVQDDETGLIYMRARYYERDPDASLAKIAKGPVPTFSSTRQTHPRPMWTGTEMSTTRFRSRFFRRANSLGLSSRFSRWA